MGALSRRLLAHSKMAVGKAIQLLKLAFVFPWDQIKAPLLSCLTVLSNKNFWICISKLLNDNEQGKTEVIIRDILDLEKTPMLRIWERFFSRYNDFYREVNVELIVKYLLRLTPVDVKDQLETLIERRCNKPQRLLDIINNSTE
jgi:hypothetical protein